MSHHGQHGDDPLRQAVEALAAAARAKVDRHPLGHLVKGRRSHLELSLSVPLNPRDEALEEAVRQADETLQTELGALLAHRTAFRPGRIFCLRCSSTDCEHSAPPDSRHVFVGYGSSGMPRFLDFAQWLLERQHPQLDHLYEQPPRLVTEVTSGRELTEQLVPAFRDRQIDYHVHGQVTAGWYRITRADNTTTAVLALSFQVLSSSHRGGRRRPRRRDGGAKGAGGRRLGLNVLASGPDGEPLEQLYHRLGSIPWTPVVQWSQSVLETIERAQSRKSATPELLSRRVEGLLNAIARRLEQDRRSRERRTQHAEKRHSAGDRPTRMAHADLARAGDDSVLVDTRRKTIIVLGERGRAHVFNSDGRLVTSIRYSPESIERKKSQEIWRPASADEVMTLRKKVGVGSAGNGET
ncbi:MAG: hypothetical protein GY856_46055 [bacterium]|nr:hypothetical protein [bacterium]